MYDDEDGAGRAQLLSGGSLKCCCHGGAVSNAVLDSWVMLGSGICLRSWKGSNHEQLKFLFTSLMYCENIFVLSELETRSTQTVLQDNLVLGFVQHSVPIFGITEIYTSTHFHGNNNYSVIRLFFLNKIRMNKVTKTLETMLHSTIPLKRKKTSYCFKVLEISKYKRFIFQINVSFELSIHQQILK